MLLGPEEWDDIPDPGFFTEEEPVEEEFDVPFEEPIPGEEDW